MTNPVNAGADIEKELALKLGWSIENGSVMTRFGGTRGATRNECELYAALLAEAGERAKLEAERDEAKNAAFFAFVAGAKWWEFKSTQGTMWQSDQREAEAEAAKRYPYAPHFMVMAEAERARGLEAQQKLDALSIEAFKVELEQERSRVAALEAQLGALASKEPK